MSYRVKAFLQGGMFAGENEAFDRTQADNFVEMRMQAPAISFIRVVHSRSKAILEEWRRACGKWRRQDEGIVAKYER